MAPRSKKSSSDDDFFAGEDIPVLPAKPKRKPGRKRSAPAKRAPAARSEAMEFHTMPSHVLRHDRLWHTQLSRRHEEWIAMLIAVVVVTAGAWMLIMCPGFVSGVGHFLRPWNGRMAASVPAAAQPAHFSTAFVISPAKLPASDVAYVAARAVEAEVSSSLKFPATGTETRKDAYAAGTVKIVNTTDRAFTFVSTTRLLSKDGVLFRLASTTAIPAKKTVMVEVKADKPGPAGDIGPSTFTIPGLSAGLQEQVYGVSDAPMTGGNGQAAVVTEADIAAAKKALADQLAKEAEDDFRALVGADERLLADLVTSKEVAFVAPKAGTAATSFEAKLTSRYRALLFPEAPAEQLLLEKFAAFKKAPDASAFDLSSSAYFVQAYDVAKDQAEVRIEGDIVPR